MKEKIINDDIEKFFHPSLEASFKDDYCQIFYHHGDRQLYVELRKRIGDAITCLKDFYKTNYAPKIIIFIYPDLAAMNEAFQRELPNDQCCFVPVKGEISLITFTAKIGMDNLSQVLVHEISHIIFSELSGNEEVDEIQQTKPVWLDEGIALLLDSKFRANLPNVEKKRMESLSLTNIDYFPTLSELYTYFNRLDGDVEFGPKGTMAYAYSYYCVSELSKRFGSHKIAAFIRKLYGNNNFNDLFLEFFGISLKKYDSEIKKMILNHD